MDPDHLLWIALSAPVVFTIRSVVDAVAKVIIARQALRDAPPSTRRSILRGVGEAFSRGRPDDEE